MIPLAARVRIPPPIERRPRIGYAAFALLLAERVTLVLQGRILRNGLSSTAYKTLNVLTLWDRDLDRLVRLARLGVDAFGLRLLSRLRLVVSHRLRG